MRPIVEVVSILLVVALIIRAQAVDRVIMTSAGALTLLILWAQTPLMRIPFDYPGTLGPSGIRWINLVSIIVCIVLITVSTGYLVITRRSLLLNTIIVSSQLIIIALLCYYREALNMTKPFYQIPEWCRLSILFPSGILL